MTHPKAAPTPKPVKACNPVYIEQAASACSVCKVPFETSGSGGMGSRHGCSGCGRHVMFIPSPSTGDIKRQLGSLMISARGDGHIVQQVALYIEALEADQAELAKRARNVVAILKKRLDKNDGYNLWLADDFLHSLSPNA